MIVCQALAALLITALLREKSCNIDDTIHAIAQMNICIPVLVEANFYKVCMQVRNYMCVSRGLILIIITRNLHFALKCKSKLRGAGHCTSAGRISDRPNDDGRGRVTGCSLTSYPERSI